MENLWKTNAEDLTVELFCGDCRDVLEGERMRGMVEGKTAIIVSDPPFNIGYHYDGYADRLTDADYYSLLTDVFSRYPSVVIHFPEALYRLAASLGKVPERVLSWCYNSNTARQHRDVAFFGVKPDMEQVRQPYKNPEDKRIRERIENGAGGGRLYDWWYIDQVKNTSAQKTAHPCQMPLEVMKHIIGVLPKECIIIDPFMGSGTTGLAVREMNWEQDASRGFIGIELNESYYQISRQRILFGQMRLF